MPRPHSFFEKQVKISKNGRDKLGLKKKTSYVSWRAEKMLIIFQRDRYALRGRLELFT